LESATFDEMNRVAAVEEIETGRGSRDESMEEILLRYRNALIAAANSFFEAQK
jgi:hypothetical protein